MDEDEKKLKEEFIDNVFFTNAWRDTSQHVKIFIDESDDFKKEFKEYLKTKCLELVKNYREKGLDSDEHLAKLDELYNAVQDQYGRDVSFSFGRTQKLVNVLLKYYWCNKMLNDHTPAHLPFDSIILKQLKAQLKNKGITWNPDFTWTNMEKKDYIECIAQVEKVRGDKTFSYWELSTYNDASKQKKSINLIK